MKSILQQELNLSNTAIKHAKNTPNGILLDGQPVYVSATASCGQVLSVLVGDVAVKNPLTPTEGDLDIIYEDEDILIVSKAAGMVVHPTLNYRDNTLGHWVSYHYQHTGQALAFRPVHRLDRGTSGLLCIAKHAHAQEVLKNQLHSPAFRRIYWAVCVGVPTPTRGVIDAPIARAEDSIIMRQVSPQGQEATTHYQVLQVGGGHSLIELELTTGRTHQIRVHMAHIGHPLVGDFLYGTENHSLIPRTALHAAKLTILHPITKQTLTWKAPLPPDMTALIEKMGVLQK